MPTHPYKDGSAEIIESPDEEKSEPRLGTSVPQTG